MNKLKKPTLLVDGDILAYRAAAACDGRQYVITYMHDGKPIKMREKYKKKADEVLATLHVSDHPEASMELIYEPEPLSEAIKTLKEGIKSLETYISSHIDGIGDMVYFTTRHGSFRDKEFTMYKKNRDDIRRPAHLEALKDYLQDHYGCTTLNHGQFEADDMMAMQQGENSVICSIDKDLLQVPGHHFNWIKKEYSIVSEEEGRRNLYTQMLTGDATDGIPGLKGIGPVKAKNILKKVSTEWMMYCSVLKAYLEITEREPDEADDEFYARCMQLLRIHARLLYLVRDIEDSWEAPNEETI